MLIDSVWRSLQWRPFFSKEAMIAANMLFTSISVNERVYVVMYICMPVYVAWCTKYHANVKTHVLLKKQK